ncbi:MAG: hypothetical protein IJC71_03335 [Clostridia bacterium]|nr:hypothetical protein [Clostridia bacterium]
MKTTSSMKTTKKVALCGVFAALALTFLYLGGLTVLDMTVLAVCALMTMILVIEAGTKMAWIYAAVTAVLALLLLPNKIYAIEYICFSALYPVAKLYFERMRTLFAWFVKISFLDILLLLCVVLAQHVFLLGDEYFALNWVTLVLGTVFFVLFDCALTVCVTFYIVKLRKRLGIGK